MQGRGTFGRFRRDKKLLRKRKRNGRRRQKLQPAKISEVVVADFTGVGWGTLLPFRGKMYVLQISGYTYFCDLGILQGSTSCSATA